MNFGANKTPVEVIKEGTFGGTYFRDIYCGINVKWYRKSWKGFDELKNIDQKYYCSNYFDVSVNKYGVKCGTSLRFWENRYCLGRKSLDDKRQIARCEEVVSRFTGKLINMIKDVNGRFDDYSILTKIRQILLHWGYELIENDLLKFIFLLMKK